jgi:hypothetical protein
MFLDFWHEQRRLHPRVTVTESEIYSSTSHVVDGEANPCGPMSSCVGSHIPLAARTIGFRFPVQRVVPLSQRVSSHLIFPNHVQVCHAVKLLTYVSFSSGGGIKNLPTPSLSEYEAEDAVCRIFAEELNQ